jgi:hypothetical protein
MTNPNVLVLHELPAGEGSGAAYLAKTIVPDPGNLGTRAAAV